VLFCTSLFTTMQNVATNGMGVDLIGADERGRMNAVMWASKSVGVAIGGGGCYALSTTVPWPFLMLAMAVVIWLIGLIPLLVRERPGEGTASAPASRLEVREIVRTFAAPAPVIALVATFLLPMGFGLLGTPLNYLLRSGLGFSEHRIGFLTGLVDAAVGIVASLAGGFLADRFGSRTVMTIASLGMIASTSWLATTADHWHSFTFMTTWYVVQFSFQYMFGAAMLTFFMSMANPSIGATHLGIYFAINNLCYTCADRWGGQLLSEFGYVQTFAVCAVVQALALIPLAMCDPRFAERMYRRPAEAKPAASA
jgi:predicted MFS family arabinose efflux permease